MSAGVWPGTWSATSLVAEHQLSPSSSNRRTRAVAGELRALVEDLAEHALDGRDLRADRELATELSPANRAPAERWSAWAWVSSTQSTVRPCSADISDDRVRGNSKLVRPDASSKFHTLSMIAALRVAGSWTT